MPGVEACSIGQAAGTAWWSINDKVQKALPADFDIRPLSLEDYDRGYLQCLGQLTLVGGITRALFQGDNHFKPSTLIV